MFVSSWHTSQSVKPTKGITQTIYPYTVGGWISRCPTQVNMPHYLAIHIGLSFSVGFENLWCGKVSSHEDNDLEATSFKFVHSSWSPLIASEGHYCIGICRHGSRLCTVKVSKCVEALVRSTSVQTPKLIGDIPKGKSTSSQKCLSIDKVFFILASSRTRYTYIYILNLTSWSRC